MCTLKECLLQSHCLANQLDDRRKWCLLYQMFMEDAREVRVKPLVSRDEFVGVAQTRHQAATFEPEDRSERRREEDPFDCRERDKTGRERHVAVVDPPEAPVSLGLDRRD